MAQATAPSDAFAKGRDFAAWLGLVPRQTSTGDRTILGKISKRGNRYLRVLFVQAAWVVLIKPKSWERHGLKPWLQAAKKRLHHNVLAIALANKLARIAWSVLAHGRNFEARPFWFVLPTLPMFLLLPVLLRHGMGFWIGLVVSCGVTAVLYSMGDLKVWHQYLTC